jgi:hypothetical protein
LSPEIIIPDGEADMFFAIAGNTLQIVKGEIYKVLPGSENLARLMKKYIVGTVEVL